MVNIPRRPCPDCGQPMRGKHKRGWSGLYWSCDNSACVTRKLTKANPMRPFADFSDIEQARMTAKIAFDPLWRGSLQIQEYAQIYQGAWRNRGRALRKILHRSRHRAYEWLCEQMGLATMEQCHFGQFNQAQCHNVVLLCEGKSAADVYRWAKDQGKSDATGRKERNPVRVVAPRLLGAAERDCRDCEFADVTAQSQRGCLCRWLELGEGQSG